MIKFRQPDRGGDNVPEAMRPASDTVLPAAPIVAVQATEREGTNLPKTDLNRPCPKRAISAEVDPKPTLADELVRTGSGANNHDYHLSATGARVNVYLERNSVRKRELQQHLTAMLPEWFGKADSNAKYALQAESLDGYLAESEGVGGGLLLLKQASAVSAEIYWMAVDPTRHRSGIGRALIATACEASRKRGVKYLFVATLHPSVSYEPYQRTRRFYEAMGFVYVLEEQFPADPESPLAYYLKQM